MTTLIPVTPGGARSGHVDPSLERREQRHPASSASTTRSLGVVQLDAVDQSEIDEVDADLRSITYMSESSRCRRSGSCCHAVSCWRYRSNPTESVGLLASVYVGSRSAPVIVSRCTFPRGCFPPSPTRCMIRAGRHASGKGPTEARSSLRAACASAGTTRWNSSGWRPRLLRRRRANHSDHFDERRQAELVADASRATGVADAAIFTTAGRTRSTPSHRERERGCESFGWWMSPRRSRDGVVSLPVRRRRVGRCAAARPRDRELPSDRRRAGSWTRDLHRAAQPLRGELPTGRAGGGAGAMIDRPRVLALADLFHIKIEKRASTRDRRAGSRQGGGGGGGGGMTTWPATPP